MGDAERRLCATLSCEADINSTCWLVELFAQTCYAVFATRRKGNVKTTAYKEVKHDRNTCSRKQGVGIYKGVL